MNAKGYLSIIGQGRGKPNIYVLSQKHLKNNYQGRLTLSQELAHIEPELAHIEPGVGSYRAANNTNTYGEVDGLKWRYVDFKNRQILIRETVVDGKMTYTKTDGSQREIRMSQPVYDALLEQWQVTQDMDFVFATRNGTPLEHNNVTKRVWYPLLRYLGPLSHGSKSGGS